MNGSSSAPDQCAIIVGAGPAGLSAAYELASRARIRPIVLEKSDYMGGISRTVNYKGNRIDIGGHRFFSKSDRVMDWWLNVLPLEQGAGGAMQICYQNQRRDLAPHPNGADPACTEAVMLMRGRLSRIYHMRKFFSYPISLSPQTLRNLGVAKVARIGLSYFSAAAFPRKNEKTLEDFLMNRFGRELYLTFFKPYTEKVWGVPCHEISAEWGAQRIKGLSVHKTLLHAATKVFTGNRSSGQMDKSTETSLIDRFLYPKYGPGQMWEEVARRVTALGGEILTGWNVERIVRGENAIQSVVARHVQTGECRSFGGRYFFSTMPVRELIAALDPAAPGPVREVSQGLMYRDFLIAGLLCKSARLAALRDNWIYIQDASVRAGRLQLFHNWSPYLVADPASQWMGLEYFCNESDPIWRDADEDILALARRELIQMGLVDAAEILDGTVVRMAKAYPAYFGTYHRIREVTAWTDAFENLFLIGRNGMHKYNNQDHSMLTAMTAVDNILAGIRSRENLWSLNTEAEYLEEK